MLTASQLVTIVDRPENANMRSFIAGLDAFGARVGLDKTASLAQYVAQMAHETMGFRYDREIWDGKGAQARYDTRTDLGNTAARDGDGYKYRGRTGTQITGKRNYELFTAWARKLDPKAPDFVADPDKANTDPWEGLGPIWYWDANRISRYAEAGNNEMVTRTINGGLNGYADRLRLYDRAALVLLGRNPTDIRGFQRAAGLVTDGISGPNTRAAMHKALSALEPLTAGPGRGPDVHPVEAAELAKEARIADVVAALRAQADVLEGL